MVSDRLRPVQPKIPSAGKHRRPSINLPSAWVSWLKGQAKRTDRAVSELVQLMIRQAMQDQAGALFLELPRERPRQPGQKARRVKQTLYLPEEMASWLKEKAGTLYRTTSWIIERVLEQYHHDTVEALPSRDALEVVTGASLAAQEDLTLDKLAHRIVALLVSDEAFCARLAELIAGRLQQGKSAS